MAIKRTSKQKNRPIGNNRASVKLSKINKQPKNAFTGPSLSDGSFSNDFIKSKAPVLRNGFDDPSVSVSAQAPTMAILQTFPDMTQPSIPFNSGLTASLNDSVDGNGITQDYETASDIKSPPINGTEDVVTADNNANAAVGKLAWWVWALAIAVVLAIVIYIAKNK